MSVTYPVDPTKPYADHPDMPRVDSRDGLISDEPFVPVYARRGKARAGQSKVKSWMILAPVGVVVLGGIGAMMFMGGSEEVTTPLVEPAATAPVLPAFSAPTAAVVAPLTSASSPAPVVTAPPVVQPAAPLRRASPAPAPRREASRAQVPTVAPRLAPASAPAPAAGPQPYAPAPAAPSASTLNMAPAAASTPPPTPPAPPIVVQPLG